MAAAAAREIERQNRDSGPTSCPIQCPMTSSPTVYTTLSSSLPPLTSSSYPSTGKSLLPLSSSWNPSSSTTSPSSIPPPHLSHDTFETALNNYLQHETKDNFINLLSEVFLHGYAIDFEMKGGQTLLHHSVSLNLERETALILNAGARILMNHHKKTPIDFALERGNQLILQLLRRSSDYFNYLKSKKNSSTYHLHTRVLSSAYNETGIPGQLSHQQQMIYGVCKYAWSPTQCKHPHESSIWAPSFHFTDVYENYLDWKDGKALEMIKELVNNLRATEVKFQNELDVASKQKDSSLSQIYHFIKELKQKEHKYCMKIWGTVEYERATRKLLETVSLKLIDLKVELSEAHKKVFFFGEGYMRYFNGFVVKTSKRVNIRITGTALQLGYVTSCQEASKTRSRIIPIDAIDEIEISSEVNSVSLNKSSHENRSSSSNATTRVSFTVRDSEHEHSNSYPTPMATLGEPSSVVKSSSTGKVYFILRFRNIQSASTRVTKTNAAAEEFEGEGGNTMNLSPVLGVPMRTPPPPHPIVLCLDDSWGEIVTPGVKNLPEKAKEKSLFARAKAKLSGKKSPSPTERAIPESPPTVTYRAKSVAHEFFEAIQCASIPETHFYGTDHFLNRNRDSSISRGSESQATERNSHCSPGDVREGMDWNGSSVSSAQISAYQGTSGLTSVESLLSGSASHRTSLASYQSRSSQSGFRMSFLERDSLQSADSSKFSAKSLPKSQVDALNTSVDQIPTAKKSFSSSYQAPRSTLLGRVAEEREDRSTSNDSSSLSHGSSQLLGLTIASDPFHDCSRSLHKEFEKFPLVEGDEEHQDQEDWKSVGSDKESQNDCSRQYSLDSTDRLVSITIDDEIFKEKPVVSPPSLLTLSLQASNSTMPTTTAKPLQSITPMDQLIPPAVSVSTSNPQCIESYSCPTTNYIPSAIEGYGPISVTSPVASPLRSNPRLMRKHSFGSQGHGTGSEAIPIRKESITEIPTSHPDAAELSSSFPMETMLRHMSSHADCSTSLSLFGESMMTSDSLHDPYYLPPSSLDYLPTTRPLLEPAHHSMHTVSFKEVEVDERLSCNSLPALMSPSSSLSRSVNDKQIQERKKKTGHSFSHLEAPYHSSSQIQFERSLLPFDATALPRRRHVVYTLTQEMNATREQRKDLESSLISCVTERENLLQMLHYLQSLRNAMKHSPAAPSENHSPTKHSNLQDRSLRRKSSGISASLSLRSSRESSGELSAESMSSYPDRNISQLSALLSAAVSNGMNDLKQTEEEESSSKPDQEAAQADRSAGGTSRQLSRDTIFREERLPSNLTEEKDRHVSEAEEFVYNLLNESMEGGGGGGASSHMHRAGQEKLQSSKDSDDSLLSLSLSQLIGPPPASLLKEYERGRDLLETLWHQDMIIFETVEKLAQCLYLREQAWQRLRKLQSQESTLVTPQDLYDIDLLS